MDKFKALSLVLLGMVIGLGYAVACGSDDSKGMAGPMLPGVGVAMAQSGCAQWEVTGFGLPTGDPTPFLLEAGWTPIAATDDGGGDELLWAARCAQ
jgi:hypothetical protein